MQNPKVGDVVYYTEYPSKTPLAALITEVDPDERWVSLHVFTRNGSFVAQDIEHGIDFYEWHWPDEHHRHHQDEGAPDA